MNKLIIIIIYFIFIINDTNIKSIIIIIKSLFIRICIEVCTTYFLWLNWVIALVADEIIFKQIMNRQWTLRWWIRSNKSCSVTDLILNTPCNRKYKLLSLWLLSAIIATFVWRLTDLIASDLNKLGLIVWSCRVDSLRWILGYGCW